MVKSALDYMKNYIDPDARVNVTVAEIIVIVAIIALLASIAVPNYIRNQKLKVEKTTLLSEKNDLVSSIENKFGKVINWKVELDEKGKYYTLIAYQPESSKDMKVELIFQNKKLLSATQVTVLSTQSYNF